MKKILGAGVLKSIKTMADGGVDYTVSSNAPYENPFPLAQKPVVFLIQEGTEMPDNFDGISEAMKDSGVETRMPVGKSPSQRLRNVLYVLWEQSGQTMMFDNFYNIKMEEITNHFKSKLQ